MTVYKKVQTKQKLLDIINYVKEIPFYNKYIEKPKIKLLKNIDLLSDLPFYEELSVVKTNKEFRGYEMIYKVELVDKKDPLSQLKASKSSIQDLFNDLLDEKKGSSSVKILLKKYKGT